MLEPGFLTVGEHSVASDRSQVLLDVKLAAPRRGAVAVLGSNVAGKTTLLKTIVGELTARSGTIAMDLQDMTRMPTERRIRLGVCYVPQEHAVDRKSVV